MVSGSISSDGSQQLSCLLPLLPSFLRWVLPNYNMTTCSPSLCRCWTIGTGTFLPCSKPNTPHSVSQRTRQVLDFNHIMPSCQVLVSCQMGLLPLMLTA